MNPLSSLGAAFFERPCLEVAPELLGCWLLRRFDSGVRLLARIVEIEAYLGDGSDPASHSHRGPTPRNRTMFGPAGRLYVYRSMGIHHCMNAVCEPAGRASALLLRAAAPLEGLDEMARARGVSDPRALCSGPGKLAQALGVTLELDASSLLRGPLRIARGEPPRERILAGPRIGISRATELPYRFFLEGDPNVTRSPLNRLAAPHAGAPPRGAQRATGLSRPRRASTITEPAVGAALRTRLAAGERERVAHGRPWPQIPEHEETI